MRRLTALSLLSSFSLFTACGPAPLDATPPQTEAERISRLEEQISSLTTALANAAPSSSPSPEANTASDSSPTAAPEGSQAVTTIGLDPDTLRLNPGSQRQLDLITLSLADNSTAVMRDYSKLGWNSSDTRYVTVDSLGTIRAVAPGTATVTVSLGNLSRTLSVIVEAAPAPSPSPTPTPTPEPTPTSSVPGLLGIEGVSPDDIEVNVGQSRAVASLLLNVRATNEEGQQIETIGLLNDLSKASWSSGNTSIATISASGTIFGVAVGTTTMTVTYGGFSHQFTVEVKSNT